MARLNSTTINDTGYLSIPVGTEAQRIATVSGTTVFFTSAGNTSWTVPANVYNVEVLVVGGGGGGGSDMGGGGGGGGVVYDGTYGVTPGASISITVASGGSGGPAGANQSRGSNGGNSVFGNITAYGGGGGASRHSSNGAAASDGASGGGGSGGRGSGTTSYGGTPGKAIYDQGYEGSPSGTTWYPGGGGGAGGVGRHSPGDGGQGVVNNITGSDIFWGGGGGGSGYSARGGNGGIGGGGGGAVLTTYGGIGYNNGAGGGGGGINTWAQTPGGAGGANTGGGGGGGAHYNSNNAGGTGGSGIVVVKYNTTSQDANPVTGGIRINSDNQEVEVLSGTGDWQTLTTPYKARQVITTSYMMGGYKSSAAWNNVNRTSHATDTTQNLGDGSLERSFNYQSGATGKDIGYVFGAGNGHAIPSNYIIGYNMRTESQYTGMQSRTLSGNSYNSGTIQKEFYMAWHSGGQSSNTVHKYNLMNEVMVTETAGFYTGNTWGMYWENEGSLYWENDSRLMNFSTGAWTSWSGTQPSNHHQQKSLMGKLNFCWAGNQGSYNGGNSFRRTSFVTRQTSGTYSKPRANCGEENFACGQDWGYMIGNYDGAQNNGSFKWYYYTETGVNGGTTMEPKGKAGASSGFCTWRD